MGRELPKILNLWRKESRTHCSILNDIRHVHSALMYRRVTVEPGTKDAMLVCRMW